MVAARENEGKGDPGADRTLRKGVIEAFSSSSSTSLEDSTPASSSTSTDDVAEAGDTTKKNAGKDKNKKSRRPQSGKLTKSKSGVIRKKKRRERPVTICLTNCRYEIVRLVGRRNGLLEVNEDEGWNIYWTDFSVSLERAMDMRRFQIVNHFPGMNEICRKDLLCRNLNRMKRLFPKDYEIFPKTWSLPADLGELQTYAHTRKNKTYICKPEMGCQGRGIFLIRNIKDLNPFGKIICQLYISKPFLIDSFKFDLRIYVLITSVDPLRVYVYKEGLARFATVKYKPPTNSNTENSYMHLTNYAVNKYSRDYVIDDEGGSKRKLSSVYKWLEDRNHNVAEMIEATDEVILKTILAAHPVLKHNYRTCFPNHDICSACFEILGFDVLIDHKLKPYVLEVNHSPSFHTDTKLDLEIKEGLLQDTFAMLNMKKLDKHKVESIDRKRVQERLLQRLGNFKKEDEKCGEHQSVMDAQFVHEMENCGGYRLIFPKPNTDKYDPFMDQNYCSLYQETAASQARANCTRTQLEEYNQKKLEDERKRVGVKDSTTNKDKIVRPESPAEKSTSKMLEFEELGGTFAPTAINVNEESERQQVIMNRGVLVRSLGVELQVFKLLCQVGSLKPEEERVFRRMNGMTFAEWQRYKRNMDIKIPDANSRYTLMERGRGQGDMAQHCPTPNDSETDMEYSNWRQNLANLSKEVDNVETPSRMPPIDNKMAGRYSMQNYNMHPNGGQPILKTNPIARGNGNNTLSNNPMRQSFGDTRSFQSMNGNMGSFAGESSGPPSPFQKQSILQNQSSVDMRRRYEHVIERRRGSGSFKPQMPGTYGPGVPYHILPNPQPNPNQMTGFENQRNSPRFQGQGPTALRANNMDPSTIRPMNWSIGPPIHQNQNGMPQVQSQIFRGGMPPSNQTRFPNASAMSLQGNQSNFAQNQTYPARAMMTFGRLDSINKGTGLYQLGGPVARQHYGRPMAQPISRPQVGFPPTTNPLMLTGIKIGPPPRLHQ